MNKFKYHIGIDEGHLLGWEHRVLEFDTVESADDFLKAALGLGYVRPEEHAVVRLSQLDEKAKWINATHKDLIYIENYGYDLIDKGAW